MSFVPQPMGLPVVTAHQKRVLRMIYLSSPPAFITSAPSVCCTVHDVQEHAQIAPVLRLVAAGMVYGDFGALGPTAAGKALLGE